MPDVRSGKLFSLQFILPYGSNYEKCWFIPYSTDHPQKDISGKETLTGSSANSFFTLSSAGKRTCIIGLFYCGKIRHLIKCSIWDGKFFTLGNVTNSEYKAPWCVLKSVTGKFSTFMSWWSDDLLGVEMLVKFDGLGPGKEFQALRNLAIQNRWAFWATFMSMI